MEMRKRFVITVFSALAAFLSAACGNNGTTPSTSSSGTEDPGTDPPPVTATAKGWVTTSDRFSSFSVRDLKVTHGAAAGYDEITVNVDETFQTVDGFGLAITQAACYNLLKMSQEDRTRLLTELFSRTEGAGSSLIRVCIGGSDFSMDEYTWCDEEGIDHFAVHPSEEEYLFPVLNEIYAINPDVQIIGSPWSCPRWMKMDVSGSGIHASWTSGRLDPRYYDDYAEYFVRWIREMEGRGYKIRYVTLQNEPLNHGNSMSLYMPWEDQRDFLKVIGPKFQAGGITTEILLFDHNYNYDDNASQKDYPLKIFADDEASRYASGSAWHNYGGNVAVLGGIHTAYPDKKILFTEASIGKWNYDWNGFWGQLSEDFREIVIGTLSRWGSGVTLWNMMLDSNGKPYRPGGCSTCYGAVSIDPGSYSYSSIDRKSHWFDIVHASAVIRPGAVRVGTGGFAAANLSYLAFKNTDGTIGIIILNEGDTPQKLSFRCDDNANVDVPARSVVSVLYTD